MTETLQLRLHHETINDALVEVVAALGGPKKVGALMRRTLAVDDSSRWVRDCLNPDRREKFGPEDLQFLLREARRVGCHSLMQFMGGEAGYTVTPVEPADEAAELQRTFIESVRQQQRMLDRLGALGAVPLKSVA